MKELKKLRGEYMTLLMRDREKYNEGLKQGIEQGIEQEIEQEIIGTVVLLCECGNSADKITKC